MRVKRPRAALLVALTRRKKNIIHGKYPILGL